MSASLPPNCAALIDTVEPQAIRNGKGGGMTMAPSILTIILNWRTADMTLRSAEAALRGMRGMPGALTIVDNDVGRWLVRKDGRPYRGATAGTGAKSLCA